MCGNLFDHFSKIICYLIYRTQSQPQFINQNVSLDMYNGSHLATTNLSDAMAVHYASGVPNQVPQQQQYPPTDMVTIKKFLSGYGTWPNTRLNILSRFIVLRLISECVTIALILKVMTNINYNFNQNVVTSPPEYNHPTLNSPTMNIQPLELIAAELSSRKHLQWNFSLNCI